MPRVHIELPQTFTFTVRIPVRITDINYGNHLGNDSVLTLMHEARLQFLAGRGLSETEVGDGAGLILRDATVVYRRQAFYGEVLEVSVAAAEFSRAGFTLYYRLLREGDGAEIARGRTAMAVFDYQRQKPLPLPDGLKDRLSD